jgi:hypothetical protein
LANVAILLWLFLTDQKSRPVFHDNSIEYILTCYNQAICTV